MPAVLGIALILGLGLLLGSSSARNATPRRLARPDTDWDESPSELAAHDPIEALRRFGTPEDAARLGGMGADLDSLGYRTSGR